MNRALAELFEKKAKENNGMYERALAEIIQSIALLGLSRSTFFQKAAFYGGTALRMLFGLDRFSEDLDFSLLAPDPDFRLTDYFSFMQAELASFGLNVEIVDKMKKIDTTNESAFLKANTLEQILAIADNQSFKLNLPPNAVTKIKIETDIDPPPEASTRVGYIDEPVPFAVRSYDSPSLFAGKMHAVLARGWKNRVKGRDWYDFVFYVRKGIPLSLSHLEARLRQTGHYKDNVALTPDRLSPILLERIDKVDFQAAKLDVERFIPRPQDLDVWNKDFFRYMAAKIKFL